jgi:hypothetical protein
LLFLPGIVETQKEYAIPARDPQNPMGICNSCQVLWRKIQSRLAIGIRISLN